MTSRHFFERRIREGATDLRDPSEVLVWVCAHCGLRWDWNLSPEAEDLVREGVLDCDEQLVKHVLES